MRPNDEEVQGNVAAFLASGRGGGGGWLAAAGRCLMRVLPRWLSGLLCRWVVCRMLAGGKTVPCKMMTVSDLIRQDSLGCALLRNPRKVVQDAEHVEDAPIAP